MERETRPVDSSRSVPDPLPALLGRRDLTLFTLLIVTGAPYMLPAMQFAGIAAFAYWGLAFLTFLLPCMYVFSWLTCQAPSRVPLYVWVIRLVDERWRSFLLFLIWWIGVLVAISILGQCLSRLQESFPGQLDSFWPQCLIFVALLLAATFLVALPLRIFSRVVGLCALLYLAFFVLLGAAAVAWLLGGHAPASAPAHFQVEGFPGGFIWPIFGLALFSLHGANVPLFMDGEMRGSERRQRCPASAVWWGSGLAFALLVIGTAAVMVIEPFDVAVQKNSPLLVLDLVFGPAVGALARSLQFIGQFGIVMVYLLTFSRALLLVTRYKCLSPYFARLSRTGNPYRMLLLQLAVILGSSFLLFVLAPFVLKTFALIPMVNALVTDDPFCLFISIASSLWAFLTALLFLFAFWIFWKKRHDPGVSKFERFFLPIMCFLGFLTSVICSFAPSMENWEVLFLARNRWFPEVLVGTAFSLLVAWLVSELPRRSVLLQEQRRVFAREQELRKVLQQAYEVQRQAYNRECDLHSKLQEAYDEQQISILQQKLLLRELNRLYREQEKAAITDPVTGLPNHRAFMQRMDEGIKRCQRENANCLVFFVDLDHFKEINDSWGHLAGDAVLCEVARRLRTTLREGDFVSRYGGEEFALIMERRTINEAHEMANHLREVIRSAPYEWQCAGEEMVGIPVTASIGVAGYGVHGTQREELIERADLAMYQAKLSGRDCVYVADGERPMLDLPLTPDVGSLSCHHYRQVESLSRNGEGKLLVSAQTLQALSAVIHTHDQVTGIHSQRVLRLVEETGRYLGVSCEDLFLIRLGGLLHDLGKVSVSSAVLNKAGPLNEAEWESMQKHPMMGARILEEIGGVFAHLAPIVMAHHERWDGLGYPRGLQGSEIPFAARILSVVDAYDAMVSRRVYKEPIPPSAARAELRRCAGTQFDPTVVMAFLAVLGTVEDEQEEFYQQQLRPALVYKDRALFEKTLFS